MKQISHENLYARETKQMKNSGPRRAGVAIAFSFRRPATACKQIEEAGMYDRGTKMYGWKSQQTHNHLTSIFSSISWRRDFFAHQTPPSL
jgi:hypothetical protein